MSRQKRKVEETDAEQPSELQLLKRIPRPDRTADQADRIRQLHAEECRARFCRIAAKRASKAVKALAALSQCANVNAYVYHQEEAEEIMTAIHDAVAALKNAFSPDAVNNNGELHFSWQR